MRDPFILLHPSAERLKFESLRFKLLSNFEDGKLGCTAKGYRGQTSQGTFHTLTSRNALRTSQINPGAHSVTRVRKETPNSINPLSPKLIITAQTTILMIVSLASLHYIRTATTTIKDNLEKMRKLSTGVYTVLKVIENVSTISNSVYSTMSFFGSLNSQLENLKYWNQIPQKVTLTHQYNSSTAYRLRRRYVCKYRTRNSKRRCITCYNRYCNRWHTFTEKKKNA